MFVEVDNVTVQFPRRSEPALQGISLRVEDGEQVALLGSSGSGKTTLLRTLMGAVRPLAGRVAVGALDPHGHPDQIQQLRRSTGMVRQGNDLVQGLSARINALMATTPTWAWIDWTAVARGRAPKRFEGQLLELATRHGITEFLDARVEHLSGGQRQRVALIRALLNDPQLLLADEPTVGLDPPTARAAVEALRGVEASTLIITTHDPEVARGFDRTIGLRDGHIVFDGMRPDRGELAAIYGG